MKKLLLIVGVLLLCFFLWYRWAVGAPGKAEAQTILIERGMGVTAIGEKLEEAGVIRSVRGFSFYNRWHGTQSLLKAGAYTFDGSEGVRGIVLAMTDGTSQERRITIPEGYTVKDIDALLAKEGLAAPGETMECARTCDFSSFEFLPTGSGLAPRGGKLEGYLYPETYFVNPAEFVPKFFLERLLGTFRERVVDGLQEEIQASGHSLHEVITLASLVEEEGRGEADRKMIAGILWNRIEAGIGLYVDATTRYFLEKPTAALTTTDLDADSPYNTRLHRGLPPGPIASPSLQSIRATLEPEESNYLYYLHGNDGVAHYAETNEEHNLNKAQYLR